MGFLIDWDRYDEHLPGVYVYSRDQGSLVGEFGRTQLFLGSLVFSVVSKTWVFTVPLGPIRE